MDQLGKKQSEQGADLERVITNYKKDSITRKTTKEYYQQRLQKLEKAWSAFEETDNQIRLLADPPLDHPYFVNDYYNAILKLYDQYQKHFNQMIDSLDKKGEDESQQAAKGLENQGAIPKPTPKQVVSRPLPTEDQVGANIISNDPELSEVTKIIRRQRGIIQSLRRLLESIQFDDTHPRQYYKIKSDIISQHWSQIENQNYSLWELNDNPATMGYDIDEYISLEERVQTTLVELSTKIDLMPTTNLSQQGSTLQLPNITLPRFDDSMAITPNGGNSTISSHRWSTINHYRAVRKCGT